MQYWGYWKPRKQRQGGRWSRWGRWKWWWGWRPVQPRVHRWSYQCWRRRRRGCRWANWSFFWGRSCCCRCSWGHFRIRGHDFDWVVKITLQHGFFVLSWFLVSSILLIISLNGFCEVVSRSSLVQIRWVLVLVRIPNGVRGRNGQKFSITLYELVIQT